ncbi:TPA: hypothetical protein VDU35_004193 [Pseudomonas aeruginosa]|nr:hypothetical protein [Pseudomonas aeruginosa]HEP8665644.1 hypothetical protein [Pseudomonas aeruginosa]
MRSSEDIYFSILDGDTLDEDQRALLSAAVIEYGAFSIVSRSERLLMDVSQRVHTSTEIRPTCILVSGGALLATAENFLALAYPNDNVDRRFFKFDLNDASIEEITQLSDSGFFSDNENRVQYRLKLEGIHPIVRNLIDTTCTQHHELTSLISQLLIGYSFLPDSTLRKKSGDSDLNGLQLQELDAFISHLKNIAHGFISIKNEIDSIVNYCTTLLAVRPASAADLSNSHPSATLQNGFLCAYKVMSVLHYLSYELAMQRKLYNKAFMHIFRSYECYSSGALFLDNARIANHTTKHGTTRDVYIIGKNDKVRGFGQVFDCLGIYFKLTRDKNYQICKSYLKLRNRFHYTHGDLKPSESLVRDFSQAALRQILKLEKIGKQKTFQWKAVYRQTKQHLMASPSEMVRAAVARELQTDQLQMFMAL